MRQMNRAGKDAFVSGWMEHTLTQTDRKGWSACSQNKGIAVFF